MGQVAYSKGNDRVRDPLLAAGIARVRVRVAGKIPIKNLCAHDAMVLTGVL